MYQAWQMEEKSSIIRRPVSIMCLQITYTVYCPFHRGPDGFLRNDVVILLKLHSRRKVAQMIVRVLFSVLLCTKDNTIS
jgi:hypothetical protein